MPPTALHLLSRRPTGCHPSSVLPLKSVMRSPHAGGPVRRSDGARVPDHVTVCPSPLVIEPVIRSPSSFPSNVMSFGLLSHCGGIAKRNAPSVNSILAIGRALPPDPTNCPTSVAVPDRSTSRQDGDVCVPRWTTRSHRPSRASDAFGDCARIPEYTALVSINAVPNATRPIMIPPRAQPRNNPNISATDEHS